MKLLVVPLIPGTIDLKLYIMKKNDNSAGNDNENNNVKCLAARN